MHSFKIVTPDTTPAGHEKSLNIIGFGKIVIQTGIDVYVNKLSCDVMMSTFMFMSFNFFIR